MTTDMNFQELVPATKANMVKYPGCFAYSFETEEECGADSNGYFLMNDEDCLTDEEGNQMHLFKRVTFMVSPAEEEAD